ncbi:MAG: hypothetical protein ACTSXU_11730, partial [Promethearchaeota archaeon]
EAYENGLGITISEATKALRTQLLDLEKDLSSAAKEENAEKYKETSEKIRKIAGNMNLSNMYFTGFRKKIDTEFNFDDYKTQTFDIKAGDYGNGSVKFSVNENGVITAFSVEQ